MRDLANRVPDDGVHHTVDVHALPDGRVRIGDNTFSAKEFADMLRRDPHFDGSKPVRLLSCDAGTSGLARDLANELGTPVTAPRGLAWTDGNGRVFASDMGPDGRPGWPPNGGWDTHNPDGTTTSASNDGFHPTRDGEDPGQRPEDAEARGNGDGERTHDDDGRPIKKVGTDSPLAPKKDEQFPADTTDANGNRVKPDLEPNTRYAVTDKDGKHRGEFITDKDGNIREVITHAGRKGDWNPDLRRPIHPDATYRIESTVDGKKMEYTYRTDDRGRTVSAEGELQHTGSDKNRRMGTDQSQTGHEGRDEFKEHNKNAVEEFKAEHGREPSQDEVELYQEVGWDGGHLIGTEFGGAGEYVNMVPMLRDLNQARSGTDHTTNYRKLEEHLGAQIEAGKKVTMNVEVSYKGDTKTPRTVVVNYTVDGIPQQAVFRNVPNPK